MTVMSLPQKMAEQWGMGSTQVLTRHASDAGHDSRGPNADCDLAVVNHGERMGWRSRLLTSLSGAGSPC